MLSPSSAQQLPQQSTTMQASKSCSERTQRKSNFLQSRSFAAQEVGCSRSDGGPVGVIVRKSLATSERLDTVCVSLRTISSLHNPIVASLGPTLQKVVEEKIDRLHRIFDKLGESGEGITLRFVPGELLAELDALIAENEHRLGLALKSQLGSAALPLCEAYLRGVCSSGVTCSYSHDGELLATYVRKWLTAALRLPMGEDGEPLSNSSSDMRGGDVEGRQSVGRGRDEGDSSFLYGSGRADDFVNSSTATSEPASARNAAMLGATNPFNNSSVSSSPRKTPLSTGVGAGFGGANASAVGRKDNKLSIVGRDTSSFISPSSSQQQHRRVPLVQSVLTVDSLFGPEAWSLILRSVHHYPHVSSLVLRSMPPQAMKLLFDLLERNELERIGHLDLSRNNMGTVYPKGVVRLAKALLYNTSLTSLDLSFNKLGAVGALAIAQSVCEGNGLIDSLNLSNNGITSSESAFGHFCRLVATNEAFTTKVRRLSLAGNRIGPDGSGLFFNSLVSLGSSVDFRSSIGTNAMTLTHLDLYHTMMGDGGCRALVSLLGAEETCGPRLRVLNLGWNGITASGVQLLCSSLESHRSLQVLRLHANTGVGRKGAIALSLMLKAASELPLRVLDLRWTNPTDDGVASIAEAATSAKYLTVIHLEHNELDPRSEALVVEKLKKRTHILSVGSDVIVTPEDEVW